MFSKVSNASKVAFISLVKRSRDNYKLLDCQVYVHLGWQLTVFNLWI
jgi:Leu/Phe-tRNA-protein transferase